jgi:hypothetical protein
MAQLYPYGRWSGCVTLGGQTAKAAFEIFPSGGGWSLLFRKPLLQAFKAIHDYKDDTLRIPHNDNWTVLTNKYAKPTVIDEVSMLKGDIDSPLRQVLTTILMNMKHVNKQSLLENFVAAEHTSHKPKQHGCRTRNRLKCDKYCQLSPSMDNIWTIQDATLKQDDMGALIRNRTR